MEVCATPQGCASPDHHWPQHQTGHAGWCNSSKTFTHSFTRLVHACHMCSLWTCSHLWTGSQWRTCQLRCCPANAKWRASSWAKALLLLLLLTQRSRKPVLPLGWLLFYAPVQLSSCNVRPPGISSVLLRLILLAATVLEELDYLCNLIGLPSATSCSQWPGHEHNTKLLKNQSGRIRREQLSLTTTCKNHYPQLELCCFGVSIAPVVPNGQVDIPEV